MELIGRYEGSGLEKPIYLARRADGKVIQMSQLLYAVALRIDGERTLEEIGIRAGADLERELTAENVAFLIENKLQPSGLIASAGQAAPAKSSEAPILGLRFRARVIPARFVHAATRLTTPLFNPAIVLVILAVVAIFDRWLFLDHGLARATQQVLLNPTLALAIFGLTVASTALHELGHATACRYGGARPGPIGVGLYLAWPVFYSDVTDTYRLGRIGRLRTDLGGVYFNVVSAGLMSAAYLLTHFEPLLLAIVLVQIDALHQFFPFFRLDGYYVASDLIGVPDLFMRMRPMLASFIPGRPLHPQVKALRPWARYAVATWVLLTFAVILFLYVLLIMALPRVLATAGQSFMVHLAEIGYFAHHGSPAGAALAVFDELILAFPVIALGLTSAVIGRRLLKAWRLLGEERPTKRMATALAATVILVVALPSMSTPAHYKPIAPSDKGTLPSPGSIEQQVAPGGSGPWLATNRAIGIAPSPSPGAQPSPSAPDASSPAPAPAPVDAASPSPTDTPATSPSPSPLPSPSPSPSPSSSPAPSPSDSPSPSPAPPPSPSPSVSAGPSPTPS